MFVLEAADGVRQREAMPSLKAFLFDLDGTLIDSLADLAAAVIKDGDRI